MSGCNALAAVSSCILSSPFSPRIPLPRLNCNNFVRIDARLGGRPDGSDIARVSRPWEDNAMATNCFRGDEALDRLLAEDIDDVSLGI